jgi:hypothetical protein
MNEKAKVHTKLLCWQMVIRNGAGIDEFMRHGTFSGQRSRSGHSGPGHQAYVLSEGVLAFCTGLLDGWSASRMDLICT